MRDTPGCISRLQSVPDGLPCHKTVHAFKPPGIGVERAIVVHDVDDLHALCLPDRIVRRVMAGSDLQCARAKFPVHLLAADDGHAPMCKA